MVEKTITRTVGMAKSKKDPVILPLHYVVKVVDSKTNAAIDAWLNCKALQIILSFHHPQKGWAC